MGRSTQGVIVFTTAEGERVVSVEHIPDVENGAENGDDGGDNLGEDAAPEWGIERRHANQSKVQPIRWKSMSERDAARQRRQRAEIPHHGAIAVGMVSTPDDLSREMVATTCRYSVRDSRRRRSGESGISNATPPRTTTTSGTKGELDQKGRHLLLTVELVDRCDMDRVPRHLAVDRLVEEARDRRFWSRARQARTSAGARVRRDLPR